MSALSIHTGSLGRYYYFNKEIEEYVRQGREGYLAILPVNRAVRLFKRQLLEIAPQQTLIDPPVFTFDDLLLRIYRHLPDAKRVIGADMLLFIIEQILTEGANDFLYLMPEHKPSPGLIKKTANVVAELRRFGYSAQKLRGEPIKEKQDNPRKYHDFELLLKRLQDYLGRQLIDDAFARHSAAEILTEERFRSLFPQTEKIFISGYGLFTPAMNLFIEKVSQWTQIHVKIGFVAENSELFEHTAEAVNRFRKMGGQIIAEEASALARRLFNRPLIGSETVDQRGRIAIQSLQEREEEVSFIAAQIRELHLKKNIPLHRMAVTFSDMERYAPLLRTTFREYAIPMNLSTGFRLNQSPLIRLFLSALRLIDSGFEAQMAVKFFQSNFIIKYDGFDPRLLQDELVNARIKFLTKGWTDIALNRLANRLKITEEKEADALDFFAEVEAQFKQFADLLEAFYQFPGQGRAQDFRRAYIELLRQLGLLDWYKSGSQHLSERQRENEYRAYYRFIKIFEKLIWTFDQIYHVNHSASQNHLAEKSSRRASADSASQTPREDNSGGIISLPEFIRRLQTAVDEGMYSLTEWQDCGVQIMPRLEIQALDSDVLFIGGLTDGIFPRASAKDIFFKDSVRGEMGLLAAEELLEQDRFIFYALLDSQAQRLFLTYPKYEGDRALTPSSFLSDLTDIAQVDWRKESPSSAFLLNRPRLWKDFGFAIQENHFERAKIFTQQLLRLNDLSAGDLDFLLQRIGIARQRMVGRAFSDFEGNLQTAPGIRKFLQKRYGDTIWSVNRLEDYAFCPMSFFLQYILKVEEAPELEEELTALERGSLVHKILYRFYSELESRGMQAFPQRHKELLFAIAQKAFAELPYSGLFWQLERRLYFGSPNLNGLLEIFVDYDQDEISKTEFYPALLEYGFGETGREEKDAASTARPVTLEMDGARLRLSGRIDRIDMNELGEALLLDYKTGRSALDIKAKHIKEGVSFQLPLYLLALAQLQPEITPVCAGYFQVKDPENCQRREVIANGERYPFLHSSSTAGLPHKKILDEQGQPFTLQTLLDRSLSIAIEKVDQLIDGVFRHTSFSKDAKCQSYCSYRRICQKNVGKLQRSASDKSEEQD